MRTLGISIIIALLFIGCYKTKEEKNYFIQGRLLVTDMLLLQQKDLPLAGKRVYLAEDNAETQNFLYTDTTDADGYFVFRLLEADVNKSLVVRFADSIQGYYYTATEKVANKMNNVILTAQLNMAKENVLFVDSKDEQGEALPGTTIRLYTNLALAMQNSPSGAAFTITSNELGRAVKTRIPQGQYYINASKTFDTLVYERVGKPVSVAATGTFIDTIVLRRKVVPIQNGFNLYLRDSLNGAVTGATVLLFTSQVLASANDSSGSIGVFVSDATGKVSRVNLPAGQYFVNASKRVDTLTYHRILKSLTLPSSGTVTDTMVLLRKVD